MEGGGRRQLLRWRQHLARLPRAPGTLGDALGPHDPAHLRLWLPGPAVRRLVLVPRPALAEALAARDHPPSIAFAALAGGLPSEDTCLAVRETLARLGLAAAWLGELAPVELASYAALTSGGPELPDDPSRAVPLAYLGADDRLLSLEEAHRSDGVEEDDVTAPLAPGEAELFEALAPALDGLPKALGPRSLALLRRGRKLPLDRAASRELHRRTLLPALLRHLRAADARPWRP